MVHTRSGKFLPLSCLWNTPQLQLGRDSFMQVRFGFWSSQASGGAAACAELRLPQGPDMGVNSCACFAVKAGLVLLHMWNGIGLSCVFSSSQTLKFWGCPAAGWWACGKWPFAKYFHKVFWCSHSFQMCLGWPEAQDRQQPQGWC